MSEVTNLKEIQLGPQEILKAGSELLEHFGVDIDPAAEPEKFIETVSQLDPRFQGGRDLIRWQLEADQTQWPEDTKQVIMRAAEAMRMLEYETPLVGQYDVVVALGGARQANLDRTRYAAEAASKGQVSFGQLIVSGSSRKLLEAEQENAANYAPGATTEYDLCEGAAKVASEEYPGLSIRAYPGGAEKAGTPIVLENTFRYLKAREELHESSRVAAVTTQIYQAATELDLARIAKKFGITETYTAGNPSDSEIVKARTQTTYLSEIIRTLKAAALATQKEQ